MKKEIDVARYQKMYEAFLAKKNTAVMSMKDEEGNPFASCAPFIIKGDALYIYISEVAVHHKYLQQNDVIDVMLVGDQADAKNPFATERIRYRCVPEAIPDSEEIFAAFDEAFKPALMNMFRKLDFTIFKLTPESGRYVVGFGLAFDTDLQGSYFNHVTVDKNKKAGSIQTN